MTDRELLELAAKAAGINTKRCLQYSDGAFDWPEKAGRWNPLTDDGDALRLAVKLHLCVTSFTDEQMVGYVINGEGYNVHELPGTDPYAATRRAITRAAADIGRNMK